MMEAPSLCEAGKPDGSPAVQFRQPALCPNQSQIERNISRSLPATAPQPYAFICVDDLATFLASRRSPGPPASTQLAAPRPLLPRHCPLVRTHPRDHSPRPAHSARVFRVAALLMRPFFRRRRPNVPEPLRRRGGDPGGSRSRIRFRHPAHISRIVPLREERHGCRPGSVIHACVARKNRSRPPDALKLPPSDRPAFLDRACAGDPDLLREVESRLRHHATGKEAAQPVEPDLVTTALMKPDLDLAAGAMLVPYRLDRKLGEGGMSSSTSPPIRALAPKSPLK